MTGAQREGLSDAALAMTQPIIDELIKDICRRVAGAGAITDTAEYQIYCAEALGASEKEIKAAIARQLKTQDAVIDSLFEYVCDKSLAFEDNGSLRQIAAAYARMTKNKTAAQLKNLWADTPDGAALPLQEAYAHNMDFAFRKVATGATDMDSAIRQAVAPLAKRGLRTIEQKSGRSVGIEYVVRRYMMDQLGSLDDEVQTANHDALGCDGWEISAHAACAPDHEPHQGRQFSDADYEALNNRLQRRIGHLNCGHTASPIIMGVNAPQYTDDELRQFREDNERGVTYQGHTYTLYEAGQKQSSIENGIRLIKRQCLADEETGSPDLQKHQIKLRIWQAEYRRYCKAMGLPTRTERLQVAGFSRRQAGRVWGYQSGGRSLDDIDAASAAGYEVTDEVIKNAPKPFFRGLSNKMNTQARKYGQAVLREVMGRSVGTEATLSFAADGCATLGAVGQDAQTKVAVQNMDVPYYALHNHASNSILSPEDVAALIKRDNMIGIGAYGNGGTLFTCEKIHGYDRDKAYDWFQQLKIKYPYYRSKAAAAEIVLQQRTEFALELIEDGEKYGLHFVCGKGGEV